MNIIYSSIHSFSYQLRYKETFENTKGKYHTVKDALNIVYHRKVTDDISSVRMTFSLLTSVCRFNNLQCAVYAIVLFKCVK